MTLMKCPECGKAISDQAESCPNCGYPVKKIKVEDKDGEKSIIVEAENDSEILMGIPEDSGKADAQNDQVLKQRRSRKFGKIIGIFAVITVVVGGIIFFATNNMRTYGQAEKLLSDKNYTEASVLFNQLGDYKNANEKYRECRMKIADELFNKLNYEEAVKIYDELGEYGNAQEKKNESYYLMARTMFNKEKYKDAEVIYADLGDYKQSMEFCEKCKYAQTVDGQFLNALAKGLRKRWEKNDEYDAQGYYGSEQDRFNVSCDLELKEIEKFYDQSFESKELQEDAKKYIDYIRESKESLKYFKIDYNTYSQKWDSIYMKRAMLISKFVKEYGLTVSKKYQKTLDDILIDASAASEQLEFKESINKMTEGFTITSEEDEWGYKTYKIKMKNMTNRTFEYFGTDISVIDNDGNIIGGGWISQIESWQPDQEATADAFFETNVSPEGNKLVFTPHYKSGSYFE
ncbi:MAG: zinc ribbon domain-containing protein [Blautia sp.]|jgi:tetratricopeptide (TPR) repeat protein